MLGRERVRGAEEDVVSEGGGFGVCGAHLGVGHPAGDEDEEPWTDFGEGGRAGAAASAAWLDGFVPAGTGATEGTCGLWGGFGGGGGSHGCCWGVAEVREDALIEVTSNMGLDDKIRKSAWRKRKHLT